MSVSRWLAGIAYVAVVAVAAGILVHRFAADPYATLSSDTDPELLGLVAITPDHANGRQCTGIVLDTDGAILTTRRCAVADRLTVRSDDPYVLSDNARLLGYDRTNDVAVIRLETTYSKVLPAFLGVADDVTVGDPVVGRSRERDPSEGFARSEGRVLALDVRPDDDRPSGRPGLIETSVEPSITGWGSPQYDSSGRMIGMTVIASERVGVFAVPIDRALAIASEIRDGKASDTVHIGPPAVLGLSVNDRPDGTLEVREVYAQGPAAAIGLRIGDVITEVAGTPLTSDAELPNLLDRYHAGDVVDIAWTDPAGRRRTAPLTLWAGGSGARRGMAESPDDAIEKWI